MKNIGIIILLLFSSLFMWTSCTPKMRGDMEIKESEVAYNKTGLPIVDEPVSIEIGVSSPLGAEEINSGGQKIFELMAERTGVRIDWNIIPESSLVAKLILMFVSNSYPEAFYGMYLSTDETQKMVDQGFLIPLNPYLEAGLMPNLAAKVEQMPELLEAVTMADGNFYSLPRYPIYLPASDIGTTMVLNREWMDALGLEEPTTLDELYEVLVAFRDGDPNGNGKQDEIPFSAVWKNPYTGLWPLFSSFGLVDSYWNHRMVRDGEVLVPSIEEEYGDAIRFFKKLYDEKLLDIEFFSQNEEMYYSKIRNDQVGFWVGDLTPPGFIEDTNAPFSVVKEKIMPILPLTGLNGEVPVWPRNNVAPLGGLEITNKCKNPEVLVRWADQFYDDEYGIQQMYGTWGQMMEKNDDGTISHIPQEPGFHPHSFTFPDGPKAMLSPGIVDMFRYKDTMQYDLDNRKKYQAFAEKEIFPNNVLFSKEENRRISSILTDTKKLIDTKQVEWITGEADIDAEWQWYLDELDKMGIHELIEIWQSGYDRKKGL